MVHANRNFVIAYIILVGLPLLGLAGVLRTGRSLNAPFSVDGTWKVETIANHASTPCGNLLSSIANAPVTISQSGKSAVIGLKSGKTTTGTLDGTILKAQFTGADNPTAADCSDRSLALTATVDTKAEPRTLNGVLSVEGCASCVLEFRATRQPRGAEGGAH